MQLTNGFSPVAIPRHSEKAKHFCLLQYREQGDYGSEPSDASWSFKIKLIWYDEEII
ncbi:MAG: hypothetical protein PHQ65_17155 [Bacteroidales bacterium]|nr:hypothetical protein [Bacteroidales bacterium]MDD3666992.1 hypothetical protein [Bacteroidales bacterium]